MHFGSLGDVSSKTLAGPPDKLWLWPKWNIKTLLRFSDMGGFHSIHLVRAIFER